MPELSDEAKAELAAAIAIVREDKHWGMVRDIHQRTKPADPPADPPTDPPTDPKNPPKGKGTNPPPPPKNDPPTDPPPKRGIWAVGSED